MPRAMSLIMGHGILHSGGLPHVPGLRRDSGRTALLVSVSEADTGGHEPRGPDHACRHVHVVVTSLVRRESVALSKPSFVSNSRLKSVMVVTGIVFIGYVGVHMVGNLKVYLGAEAMNDYAGFLRELLVPLLPHEWVLWGFRAVLSVCLVGHVAAAALLTARARTAGSERTSRGRKVAWWRSFTSRTMPISGIVIAAFVVFHILDLTLGTTGSTGFRHPETLGGETRYFAYENLVGSFQRPIVAVFYVVAMLFLGAHLLHGSWAVVNDLGATGDRTRRVAWIAGTVVATTVMVGNISIPVAVMIGWVQ